MIYTLWKRFIYYCAWKIHNREVRRNRSSGSRKGWITRKALKGTP